MKRVIASALAATMALATVTPAAAQAYRYSEAFAPRQDEVTATVNFRLPLGGNRERPTYGLTINAQRGENTEYLDDGRSYSPEATLAEFRFDGTTLNQAQIGAWDFAQPGLGWDDSKDPKDPKTGKDGKDMKDHKTWWVIGGLVVVGVAIAASSNHHHHHNDSPGV